MKAENTDSNSIIILFFLIFGLSFFISYLLTLDFIFRYQAVTLDEEAKYLSQVLNTEDLNNLYQDSLEQEKKLGSFRKYPVIILGYHQIREYYFSDGPKTKLFITWPETFEKEMKYLFDQGYQTISLTEYLNYLKNQDSIPEKSVIITFDDGYVSQYNQAFPILQKYNFLATFFIYQDCIDKYPACMTTKNLQEMASGSMKLANHTLRHSFLTKYKDETIISEINKNQAWLEKTFSAKQIENVLAYPYGATDLRVQNIIKNLGYLGAVGVKGGFEKDKNNFFNLRRYLLGNDFELFKKIFAN